MGPPKGRGGHAGCEGPLEAGMKTPMRTSARLTRRLNIRGLIFSEEAAISKTMVSAR